VVVTHSQTQREEVGRVGVVRRAEEVFTRRRDALSEVRTAEEHVGTAGGERQGAFREARCGDHKVFERVVVDVAAGNGGTKAGVSQLRTRDVAGIGDADTGRNAFEVHYVAVRTGAERASRRVAVVAIRGAFEVAV